MKPKTFTIIYFPVAQVLMKISLCLHENDFGNVVESQHEQYSFCQMIELKGKRVAVVASVAIRFSTKPSLWMYRCMCVKLACLDIHFRRQLNKMEYCLDRRVIQSKTVKLQW